ncbi:hypothetical protein F5888DRAFT_728909 [Russula emetica]|nr:hypothetical protein F5888DRAFT_728909 [Russula emetica]
MAQDDSDSESGLPEIISFSTSASVEKGQHHALRSFHALEKRKIKERNRRHDERLKAQANMRRRVTATTGKSKHHAENHEVETGDNESGNDLDPRLHWRMTRAMGNAEEESDGANASAEEWGGINVAGEEDVHRQVTGGQDVEMSRGEGREETEGKSRNADPDSGEGEGDDDGLPGALHSQVPSSKYLPDHVFVAARPKLNPENDVRISQTTPKTRSTRKRHPVLRARRKDVVVGTRTVRTLSSSPASVHVQSQGTTLRPALIDKFVTNALRLGGKDKKISPRGNASRWERRPSHLGVMKRAVGAPVTGFARTSQH